MKLIPTAEETLEYNKKCAEFLGWVKYSGINPAWNDSYDTNKIHFGEKTVHLRYMKFYSDWNWIMEVVEKIEELDIVASFQIEQPTIYIWNSSESSTFEDIQVDIFTMSKKEAVVEAINQFLIWYKEQTT